MQRTRLLLVVSLLLFAVASRGFVAHRSSRPASPTTSRRNNRLLAAAPTQSDRPNALATVVKHTLLSVLVFAQIAGARPEGVNRPDLLPKEANVPLIDVANFLSKGQEKKVVADLADLEKRTGYKLRVLCQSYPNTPGLAIKEYWGVDDNTVVLVVDKGEGFNKQGIPTNVMNLNIGKNADDALPGQFWQRLVNKLGNQPYVKENGADVAVLNAVQAITFCLGDKDADVPCRDLPFKL